MIKLYGVTFTYNEEKMIPYVLPYLERMNYDKLIVYDNMSTDRTVELLKQYPWIEIRQMDTDGGSSSTKRMEKTYKVFKEIVNLCDNENNCWFSFSDFDEVIYYEASVEMSFKYWLNIQNERGFNYLNKNKLNLLSENFPEIKEHELVHSKINRANFWTPHFGSKICLIKVKAFQYLQLTRGNHSSLGVFNEEPKSLNKCYGIHTFHLKYLDKEYTKERSKKISERKHKAKETSFCYDLLSSEQRCNMLYEEMFGNSFELKNYFLESALMSDKEEIEDFQFLKKR